MDFTTYLMIAAGASVVVCVLIYYFTHQGGGGGGGGAGRIRKTVMFLMPGERRGIELKVEKETDFGLYTKKAEGVTRRFIKLARGFTIKRGGGSYVTFFGLEGTIFTAAPGKISMKRSLSETLKFLWGGDFYEQIPDPERKIIENGQIGVTVEVDPSDLSSLGISEEDESEEGKKILRMSSVDVNAETDAQVLETIANANRPVVNKNRELYQMLIGAGLGFGLCLFFHVMGWIR